MLNDMIHAARAKLRHWGDLIRVACVVAVAFASVMHVAADFRSVVQADALAVSAAQPEGDRSAAATAEACHSCCVVAFFAADQKFEVTIQAAVIPAGRAPHLLAFQQGTTTPPPRALT